MSKILQVVAGIIENDNGQVLIAKRPPGKLLAGFWEFPGGKIETGESAEVALERELLEELELAIAIRAGLGVFPYAYDWGTIDLHVLAVRALNNPAPTESVHEFQWVFAHDIDPEILAAADRKPLEVYLTDSRPKPR